MVAKAGLGLIGLSAISVGGVALTNPGWLGMSNIQPKYEKTLSSNTNLTDKWVKDYKIYFVDAEGSDDWWDWVFENIYKKDKANIKTKFQNVTSGKGKTTNNSLAQACQAAYDATGTNVKTTVNGIGTNDFLEDNVWKYCSVGGTKLKLVKDDTDKNKYKDKLGKQNENDLLSVDEQDNDWAWHIKQKEFLNGTKPTTQGVFQKFHTDNAEKHKNEEKGTRLRDECKKHYGGTESTESSDSATTLKATELKKYCSLKVS